MLYENSLLKEITKALATNKFAKEIKEGLTDPSKEQGRSWSPPIRGGECFIETISYMFRRASVELKFSKGVMMTPWLAIWSYKDTWINLTRILVPSTMEVRQGIHQCMWYLCSIQINPPYDIRVAPTTSHSQPTLGIYFHGYDTLLVMVVRFSKMAHFFPCAKTISVEATTGLFLKNVVRLRGLLNDVTSHREP